MCHCGGSARVRAKNKVDLPFPSSAWALAKTKKKLLLLLLSDLHFSGPPPPSQQHQQQQQNFSPALPRQQAGLRRLPRLGRLLRLFFPLAPALRGLPRPQGPVPSAAARHRPLHPRPRPRPRRVRRHPPREGARDGRRRRRQDDRQAPHRREHAGPRRARALRGRGHAEGERAPAHRGAEIVPRGRKRGTLGDGEKRVFLRSFRCFCRCFLLLLCV